MNINFTEALRQVMIRKNIDQDVILETLKSALSAAAKKRYGSAKNLIFEFEENTGRLSIFLEKKVSEEIRHKNREISLEDAREIDPNVELEETVKVKVNFNDFGRTAIQTAKQVMTQRMRELERDQIYETYSKQISSIVTGTVRRMDSGKIIVGIGKTEGIVPSKEKIGNESYRQGDTIKAYILKVLKETRGPQIILSRTHPGFLEKLFELEVPEIQQGIVEIKAVSRDPGDRAKIAVRSTEARVDPVGACVGVRGSRVQAVVKELRGERIDIVQWHEEPAIYVSRALSPAKVNRVIIYETERKMRVIVDKDQLSLAIGRAGQNARLSSKLTGWKIDLITTKEYEEETEEAIDLNGLPSMTDELYDTLHNSKITTAQELVELGKSQLIKIKGIDADLAETLVEEADILIRELEQFEEEEYEEENEEDVEEDDEESESDAEEEPKEEQKKEDQDVQEEEKEQ